MDGTSINYCHFLFTLSCSDILIIPFSKGICILHDDDTYRTIPGVVYIPGRENVLKWNILYYYLILGNLRNNSDVTIHSFPAPVEFTEIGHWLIKNRTFLSLID